MEVLEHQYFLQCAETVQQQSGRDVRWEERAEGDCTTIVKLAAVIPMGNSNFRGGR